VVQGKRALQDVGINRKGDTEKMDRLKTERTQLLKNNGQCNRQGRNTMR